MDELLERIDLRRWYRITPQPPGAGADTAFQSASYESGVGGTAEQPLCHWGPHRETDWLSQEKSANCWRSSPDPDADGRAAESGEKHLEQMSEQAGKRNEKRFSLPGIRLPRASLPDIPWASLLLGLAALALTGLVLWVGVVQLGTRSGARPGACSREGRHHYALPRRQQGPPGRTTKKSPKATPRTITKKNRRRLTM